MRSCPPWGPLVFSMCEKTQTFCLEPEEEGIMRERRTLPSTRAAKITATKAMWKKGGALFLKTKSVIIWQSWRRCHLRNVSCRVQLSVGLGAKCLRHFTTWRKAGKQKHPAWILPLWKCHGNTLLRAGTSLLHSGFFLNHRPNSVLVQTSPIHRNDSLCEVIFVYLHLIFLESYLNGWWKQDPTFPSCWNPCREIPATSRGKQEVTSVFWWFRSD